MIENEDKKNMSEKGKWRSKRAQTSDTVCSACACPLSCVVALCRVFSSNISRLRLPLLSVEEMKDQGNYRLRSNYWGQNETSAQNIICQGKSTCCNLLIHQDLGALSVRRQSFLLLKRFPPQSSHCLVTKHSKIFKPV